MESKSAYLLLNLATPFLWQPKIPFWKRVNKKVFARSDLVALPLGFLKQNSGNQFFFCSPPIPRWKKDDPKNQRRISSAYIFSQQMASSRLIHQQLENDLLFFCPKKMVLTDFFVPPVLIPTFSTELFLWMCFHLAFVTQAWNHQRKFDVIWI